MLGVRPLQDLAVQNVQMKRPIFSKNLFARGLAITMLTIALGFVMRRQLQL